MKPRLKELFTDKIQKDLMIKFNLKNLYMVPEIQKIVLNMGLGLDGKMMLKF